MRFHSDQILVPLKIRLHILLESLPALAPQWITLKEDLTVAVRSHSLRLYILENYPACSFPENRSWQIGMQFFLLSGKAGISSVKKAQISRYEYFLSASSRCTKSPIEVVWKAGLLI